MNKKSMSISIMLLVVLTLVTVGVSLTYFVLSDKKINYSLKIPNQIDSVYSEEAYLNFYLKDLFKKASSDLKLNDEKQVFIDKINENLKDYNDPYLIKNMGQITNQLKEENIEITKEKLIWKIEFVLEDKSQEAIEIKYNYKKEFEKKF